MKKYLIIVIVGMCYLQSAVAQPPNDDPCGAISLSMQTGSVCTPSNAYSWTGATATSGIPDPGCASYTTGDIWFSFVAPASGQVNINTTEGSGGGAITDGGMAVYYNPGLCSVLTFALYACDDDSGPGLMPALNLAGLLPGIKYYIRFWDFHHATSGNIGGICVTDPYPPLVSSGAVGIGIQNPDNLLDINGVIKIRGGLPAPGKVLTSDGSGTGSWVLPAVILDPIPFKAVTSSDITIGSGILNVLNFNVEEYDYGGNFSLITFTAPATGIYHFDATVNWFLTGVPGISTLELLLYVGGILVHEVNQKIPAFTSQNFGQTISADLSLASSQAVTVRVFQTTGVNQIIIGNGTFNASYFNGHRVK